MTNKDLEIGGLYHYLTPRRIVFYGSQGEILISGKEDELIQVNEPFVLLEIIRSDKKNTFRFNLIVKRYRWLFRCKIRMCSEIQWRNYMIKNKTYKLEFTLDPPMDCPEFGEWSGDPNIALKDKHGLVTITVDAEAKPSLEWFMNLIKPIVDEYVITGYDEVE